MRLPQTRGVYQPVVEMSGFCSAFGDRETVIWLETAISSDAEQLFVWSPQAGHS
jgi:hypothetical protein